MEQVLVTKALVPHATPEGCQTLKVSPSSLRPYYTPPSPLCYSSNLRRPCFSQIPLMAPSLSVGIPYYWVPSLTSPLHSRTDTWVGSPSLEVCSCTYSPIRTSNISFTRVRRLSIISPLKNMLYSFFVLA